MSNDIPKMQRALATMQPFLASFLGLAAVRAWMQSNFFGSYTQSDAGLLSIVNQLFYGLTMLIAAYIALRKTPEFLREQCNRLDGLHPYDPVHRISRS